MIGQMSRVAFEAWLKTDEVWRDVAPDLIRELAADKDCRAVVFSGDDGATAQPTMEDLSGEGDLSMFRNYGWFDAKLASVPVEHELGARFAFHKFVNELDHALKDGPTAERMFPGVMLYIRSKGKGAGAQRSGIMRKVYVIKLKDPSNGGGEIAEPKRLPYLPWAYTSEDRARSRLEDAATVIAAKLLLYSWWTTYRLVVSDGQCRIEAPLPPCSGERKPNQSPWKPSDQRILTVESIMVPEEVCQIPTADGDFLVMDWTLALTKCWETRWLTQGEWLDELDPMRGDGSRVEKCDWWTIDLGQLTPYQWMTVLRHRPDLAEKCPCWKDFDDVMWCVLLRRQPQFETRFKNWSRLPSHLRTLLLRRQPTLVKHFPATCWHGFSSWDWVQLLKDQPLFASVFKDWDQISGGGWCRLLTRQPQFAAHCDWSKFDWTSVGGNEWTELVTACPEFLSKAEGRSEVWKTLSASNWQKVLRRFPEMECLCGANYQHWVGSTYSDVLQLIDDHPALVAHCDFSGTEEGVAVALLKDCPGLAESPLLDCLKSWPQWFCLLSASPAFWSECEKRLNWSELTESQIVDILIDHPEAVRHVDLGKIAKKVNWWRLKSLRKEFRTDADQQDWAPSVRSWQLWHSASGIVHAIPVKGNLFDLPAALPCEALAVLTLSDESRLMKAAFEAWCQMNGVAPHGLTKCPADCRFDYVRNVTVPMEGQDFWHPPIHRFLRDEVREALEKVLMEISASGVTALAINGISIEACNEWFLSDIRCWLEAAETSIRVIYLVDREGRFGSRKEQM